MSKLEQIKAIHKKHKGKLSIEVPFEVKNKETLSLIYSPGVAEICNLIQKDRKNLWKYTIKQKTVAVISNGTAVLGLGNIGADASLPVMEGKAALLKQFAGIDTFPICINEQDPDKFIDIVKKISTSFGAINLEDIKAPECVYIEERLNKELDIPVFHDDQHGTAIVVLAGLINALKVANKKIKDVKISMSGAGAAGSAIIKLLIQYGFKDIIVCNKSGIVKSGLKTNTSLDEELAKITNGNRIKGNDLESAIKNTDIFIGVSAANILTKKMIATMNEKPIIFALANPNPEINIKDIDKSIFIIATGRSDLPNQVNNLLAFPSVFRYLIDNQGKKITTKEKIKISEAIASFVKTPKQEKIVPSIFERGLLKYIQNKLK